MIKREVLMPEDLIAQICEIVDKEHYELLKGAFPKIPPATIFLSKAEADALATLAVVEKKKAGLKYPYYNDKHSRYNEAHEEKFDDVKMGIYEKALYCTESAFKKREFEHLL